MKAIVYHQFKQIPKVEEVEDPKASNNGVVIKVEATGLCLSDWHGWIGHDPDIKLPHIPGHELAGTIVEIGKNIKLWKVGDRVTLPFVCGCGNCPQCYNKNQHICDHQFQPGFTAWGSFAEYVAIEYAEHNLVHLPGSISFETAASLGCRFVTSYRAVVKQGQIKPDQWISIYGCGGIGLSAIMIAKANNAKVIAIDINDEKLEFAKKIGADVVINSLKENPVNNIKEITQGGVHVSLDALGHSVIMKNSIESLQKQGKHIQVGLMTGEHALAQVPMDLVLANELELIGSHGMQAHQYPEMLELIKKGILNPSLLNGEHISLNHAAQILPEMNEFKGTGIKIINRFI